MGKPLRKVNRGFTSKARWDEPFKEDVFVIPSKATQIRLYNEFTTVPHHYVEFYSKKQESKTGFYALCLNWDYETGEEAKNGCPYCAAKISVNPYNYGLCLWRKEQRNTLIVRPIRLTAKCTTDILGLTESAYPDESYPEGWKGEDGEGPDATDPVYGFDFTIKKTMKNSKTEYVVSCADNGKVPLKKAETKAFQDAVAMYNFGALAAAGLETKEEVIKKLANLGVTSSNGTSEGSSKGKSDKSNNYADYDGVPDDTDEDEAPKTKTKTSAASEPKAVKRATLTEDEDDEDEDDEVESAGNPAKGYPLDDDEDDDDDEPAKGKPVTGKDSKTRSYADDDEDEPSED